jgi:hypothetical protein
MTGLLARKRGEGEVLPPSWHGAVPPGKTTLYAPLDIVGRMAGSGTWGIVWT